RRLGIGVGDFAKDARRALSPAADDDTGGLRGGLAELELRQVAQLPAEAGGVGAVLRFVDLKFEVTAGDLHRAEPDTTRRGQFLEQVSQRGEPWVAGDRRAQ